MQRRHYIIRALDLASQALNTLLLNGSPDESTSGRAYREAVLQARRRWRLAYRFINGLFFWEQNHCADAYRVDLTRAQARLELNNKLTRPGSR